MRKKLIGITALLFLCLGLALANLPAFGSPAWTYTASISPYCNVQNNDKSVSWSFTNTEPDTASNSMDITVQLSGQADQVHSDLHGGSTATGSFDLGSGSVPGGTVHFQMAWHNHSGTDSASRSFSAIPNCYQTATPINTTQPSATPTSTQKPTSTATDTQEPSATPTDTQQPSATPTHTSEPSVTPSDTQEPSATPTDTVEPSATPTGTQLASPTTTDTQEQSPTPTNTSVASITPTSQPTSTPTGTQSVTPTGTQPGPTAQPSQTPVATTETPPTEKPFTPPTGTDDCFGATITNNSNVGISVILKLDGVEQWRGDMGVFQTLTVAWNGSANSGSGILEWTDNHGRSGSIGLGSFGPCTISKPNATPSVQIKTEGSDTDVYAQPIGSIQYPALGLSIPIALGTVWGDGTFHHALRVAGQADSNSFGIHQSFAPNLAQAKIGDLVLINGTNYRVAQVVIVPFKNQSVMNRLLSGWTTITTCTQNWRDNQVILLERLRRWHDFE